MLASWEREHQTTIRVLRAFPGDQADFRPHARAYSAKELACTFLNSNTSMTGAVLNGARELAPRPVPTPPERWPELLAALDQSHRDLTHKLEGAGEDELARPIRVPLQAGQQSDVPRAQVLWLALMDQIHHRGQFSVYLRLAGGKVPSIYGPRRTSRGRRRRRDRAPSGDPDRRPGGGRLVQWPDSAGVRRTFSTSESS